MTPAIATACSVAPVVLLGLVSLACFLWTRRAVLGIAMSLRTWTPPRRERP